MTSDAALAPRPRRGTSSRARWATAVPLAIALMSLVLMAGTTRAKAAPAPGAPTFASADNATFTNDVAGSFQIVTTGTPVPTLTEGGILPYGMGFDPAGSRIWGTPSVLHSGRAGPFSITLTATNSAGTTTQSFTLFVRAAPSIDQGGSTTFTYGFYQIFDIGANGYPNPTLTETGAIPAGLSYSSWNTTAVLSGTPAPGSEGVYPLTITASNGVGPPVGRTIDILVQRGGFLYPTDGQQAADTTQNVTWQMVGNALGYHLVIGTGPGGSDLVDSGDLTTEQPYYPLLAALPTGQTLYATLSVKLATSGAPTGAWSTYRAITFTAARGMAVFTFPTNGQTNVVNNAPLTWAGIPGADGYALAVGTHPNGTDVFSTFGLPPSQTSYLPPRALPSGVTLYAAVLTSVHNQWTRAQTIAFTAAPGAATFVYPADGQLGVDTTKAFTWSPIPQAQAYYVLIGTTRFGADVVNSGVLPANLSSYLLPTAPPYNVTVYATIFTEVNGTWTRYTDVSFSANPGVASFTRPLDGATNVDPHTGCCSWDYLTQAQGYYLIVGTTRYGSDVLNTGILTNYPGYRPTQFPAHATLYATLFTEIGGTWSRYQAIAFTTA
jgi:hypothetical protein